MRLVFLSDVHFNRHNVLAWRLTCDLIRIINPKVIVFGGDMIDCYSISKFATVEPYASLQEEIDSFKTEISYLLNLLLPHKPTMYYLSGNHTERIQTYLDKNAKELKCLANLSIPQLLGLGDLHIEYKEKPFAINNFWFMHGHELGTSGATPAQKYLDYYHVSGIIGHFHKFEVARYNTLDGRLLQFYTNGCLQDFGYDNVEPYLFNPHWDLGFTELYMLDYSHIYCAQHKIHIRNNRASCYFRGALHEYAN